MHTTLGQRIALARDRVGLSQSGLAEAVGTKRNTVGEWENDASAPSGRYIPRLLEVLDVDANWLFTESYRDVAMPAPETLEDLKKWLDQVLPTSRVSGGRPPVEQMAAWLEEEGWVLTPPPNARPRGGS